LRSFFTSTGLVATARFATSTSRPCATGFTTVASTKASDAIALNSRATNARICMASRPAGARERRRPLLPRLVSKLRVANKDGRRRACFCGFVPRRAAHPRAPDRPLTRAHTHTCTLSRIGERRAARDGEKAATAGAAPAQAAKHLAALEHAFLLQLKRR
jgi:hypothetical protein